MEEGFIFITGPEDDLREEMRKCEESPAYFFNKYVEIRDKNGVCVPKRDVTDEEIRQAVEMRRREQRHRYAGETYNHMLYRKLILEKMKESVVKLKED